MSHAEARLKDEMAYKSLPLEVRYQMAVDQEAKSKRTLAYIYERAMQGYPTEVDLYPGAVNMHADDLAKVEELEKQLPADVPRIRKTINSAHDL